MAKQQTKKNVIDPSVIEVGGRIPPQAVEIEEAILGGMLIEARAATTALELLSADDFYKPAHRVIFSAMKRLSDHDNPLDLLTLESELRDTSELDLVGGTGYLTQLTRSVSSAANIEYHAQIIAEKSTKRRLILTCSEIIKDAFDATSDTYDLIDDAERKVYDLSNARGRSDAQDLYKLIENTINHIVEIRDRSGGLTGVPSMLDIDDMTAGWQKGDLIIIAARPSMGKTAFTLTCTRNAALHPDPNHKTAVAFFSLEMSAQQLVQRLLTMEARVDAQAARTGRITQEDFVRLVEAAGHLSTAKILIDDTPGISLMELRSKCRRMKKEHNLGLVIIDYLQLMSGGIAELSREQEIAYISRGLKGLAKELAVPVIALSQLSRAVEQRGANKRPQLSDLRESGSIEQDADVVCFLYRPEYYGINQDPETGQSTEGVAEVIIGKQRNGPVGTKRLRFINKYARFDNLANFDDSDMGGYAAVSAAPSTPAKLPSNKRSTDESAPF